jgi:hypothetical protein
LLAWGPWDKWLDRVKTLASYKWFFPKLNFESSVKALDIEPEGTYLARFSESSLDKLVIIYKTTGGDIKQTQVIVSQNGFGVRDVIYPSLQKVVASFGTVLSRPLDAQYLRMPWFHGVIDSDKASEWLSKSGKPVLASSPPFSTLIRCFIVALQFLSILALKTDLRVPSLCASASNPAALLSPT